MTIKGYRLGVLLKATGKEILDDRVTTLAAQTAYYFFFSLFPLFLFAAPLLSLVADRGTLLNLIMSRIETAVPTEAAMTIRSVLRNIIFAGDAPGLMSLGAFLAAWSGSNVFGALMNALNAAYDVDESRPFWKRTALRLVMLVIGGAIMLTATLILLAGEDIARFIGSLLGIDSAAVVAWNVLQFPVAFAILVLLAFLTYWVLPNVRQRAGHLVVVAIVTSSLWLAATLLFRLYVQRFPPNPAYGLIGGIMVLLTWMYYTMFVVLAGGELASEIHRGTGRTQPPKGATYFGRIVAGEHPGAASTAAAP